MAHAYKPAPEVYLTAARLLGVQPDELMLVAATGDLEGARRAGLRTALVERPSSTERAPANARFLRQTSRSPSCTS